MSVDTSEQNGAGRESRLQEIVLTIEKARRLAIGGRYKFLTYLLDMACLEANGLLSKAKD